MDLLVDMGPSKFTAVGVVALAYAAIFATKGTGLWLRKHWADGFTVIAAGSLIPIELYEAFRPVTLLNLGRPGRQRGRRDLSGTRHPPTAQLS